MIKNICYIIFFVALLFSSVDFVSADDSIEYKLAVVDSEGYVKKNDIKVARFRSLLKQLSDTCVENKKKIADMTVTAQMELKKLGIKESMLNMMEGMNNVLY